MPNSCRITSFDLRESSQSWRVSISAPLPPEMVDFGPIFLQTFSGVAIEPTERIIEGFELAWKTAITIPKEAIEKNDIGAFLRILHWTVTLADEADESHAVYLHSLPHPTADPDSPNWKRTRMGNLVNKAKSYSPYTGSKPAAKELAEKVEHWLKRHPGYRVADVIIPVPPGNPMKVFDLPLFVAQYLSKAFKIPLGYAVKIGEMQQQKEVEQDIDALHANVAGKFLVRQDLTGQTALVFDDLYRSGATMSEVVKACRAAGARTVLSLVATKTAKFCRGLTPEDWYKVSMEAEKTSEDSRNV